MGSMRWPRATRSWPHGIDAVAWCYAELAAWGRCGGLVLRGATLFSLEGASIRKVGCQATESSQLMRRFPRTLERSLRPLFDED